MFIENMDKGMRLDDSRLRKFGLTTTFVTITGWMMSRIVLFMAYYLVITPIGIITRIFGYNTISRGFNKTAKSYWIPKVYASGGNKKYENQF